MIMPKSDYISDNLVNIRERLKQNNRALEGTAKNPIATSTESVKETSQVPLLVAHSASSRSGRSEELERLRHDLGDRLRRDMAATSVELEQAKLQVQELEKFSKSLECVHTEFLQLGSDSGELALQLDRLRSEYFRASGRASAFSQFGRSGVTPHSPDPEPKTWGRMVYEALPLALAIFLSALVIAIALLVSLL